jgi:serine/threonine protein kinase
MALMPGTRFGAYDITARIGAGGMGEVYQALDTNLGRLVAIKTLPASAAPDQERLTRFEREAKILATLNHPNIAQIYGLETSNGVRALVMELVEGSTLSERIAKGPVPLDEALPIARQIAHLLEAAHENGIIHRDLKPGNVMIRGDGTVKVLDFGLAKNVVSASSTDDSPTTIAATFSGLILGTAAYMAPEQARGRHVDKRVDIWAFGVLVHELLTGRRLFGSEDLASTLARVLQEQPDFNDAPPEVRPLLAKCLEKDPRRRLRDIGDFELLIGAGSTSTSTQVAARRWPWILAAAASVAASTAFTALWLREPAPQRQQIQFALEPPPATQFNNGPNAMTPSPDGRFIVFGAGEAPDSSVLWLRSLDTLTARPLPGTEGGAFTFWSPDSKSLAFTAGGKLKRIAITGGPAVTLADSNGAPVTPIGTWNQDGVILFGSNAGLRRVSASGGESTLLTKTDPARKEAGHGFPQFLPDGKRFLYFVQSTDAEVQGVYVSSLDAPERRQRIVRTASKAFYAPSHAGYGAYLLWLQDQTLLAQRFEADEMRLLGEPVAIAEDIAFGQLGPVRAAYWVSDAGLLVYFGGAALEQRRIVWMSRDGRPAGEAIPPDRFGSLALSPDTQQIAVERTVRDSRGATAKQDVWLWTVENKRMTKLTFDAQRDRYPIWSPDNRRIAFVSDRTEGIPQIYRKDSSGGSEDERLTDGPNGKITMDWSRDGRYLLYREVSRQTGMDLWALPLDGPTALKPFPLLNSQFNEGAGRFSPDGKWLAYSSNETGVSQIYVRAFPPEASRSTEKWQISQNGGLDMRWRGDGRELYWVTQDGKIWAADIETRSGRVQSGTPHELFTAAIYTATAGSFDVTPDGQRFLLLLFASQAEGSIRLNVVSNWQVSLPK